MKAQFTVRNVNRKSEVAISRSDVAAAIRAARKHGIAIVLGWESIAIGEMRFTNQNKI